MTIWSSISTYTIAWIARSASRLTWSAMLTRHCCTSCVNYVKCHNDNLAFSLYYVYNIVTNIIVIRILLKFSSCIYDDVVSTAPSIAWIRANLRRIQSIGGPVVVSIKLAWYTLIFHVQNIVDFVCCPSYYKSIYVPNLTFSSIKSFEFTLRCCWNFYLIWKYQCDYKKRTWFDSGSRKKYYLHEKIITYQTTHFFNMFLFINKKVLSVET